MNSIVPFTTTCMACTQPFQMNITQDKVNIDLEYLSDTNEGSIIVKQDQYPIDGYQSVSNVVTIIYNDRGFNNKNKTISKYKKNINSKTFRKYRKIHQPGRTNCTQRYHQK